MQCYLNEDEFDIEEEEFPPSVHGEHMSRKDLFMLLSLDSKIDKNDIQQERLSHLKHQVLDKTKTTKMRQRSSSGLKRRYSLLGTEDLTASTSRPRTASPPAQQ